jgi:hypothetical protein
LSQNWNPHRRRPLRRALVAGILCAMLGGCAGGFSSVYDSGLWVEPGKYDFLKCPDIVRSAAGLAALEKGTMALMAKADQEAAGPIINITVYQAQLEQIRAQSRLLQQTAREKGCDLTAPAAKNAPPAAPARNKR